MQPHRTPRRVSVKGHAGIYYRLDRKGERRYEITFLDSSGKRCWRTVDGGLREAGAALREVGGRKDRGERVVTTRATVAEVAKAWLDAQTELRPRTREGYENAMRLHILPRFGGRRVSTITEDDVANLIAELRTGVHYVEKEGRMVREQRAEGYAGWTIRGVLVPLSRLLAYAARRGYIAANPVSRLERGERPKVGKREKRILTGDEIGALLESSLPGYRTLMATAVYTGVRQSEALGLVWRDVDFEAGFVRVRRQLDRKRGYAEPKTPQAIRDVVLAPALGRLLREHRLASPHSRDDDPVFANAAGRPFEHRNVQSRGFDKAAERSGLNVKGDDRRKATFHDLRHTFASLLIAQGADVVHVSKQLGHADASITLKVYADEFAAADHADRTRALLDAAVGNLLETSSGDKRPTVSGGEGSETAQLRVIGK
jgi:integrase